VSKNSKRTAGVTVRRITCQNQGDLLKYIQSQGIKDTPKSNKKK
jgi:hypothetical protein